MNENELYINHGIYYRLYGNVCYVWDTKTRRQFIFNSTVYDIFELIKRKGVISSENLIQQLSKKYSDNVCIISEAVIPFLGKLKEEKIIRSETDSDSIDIDQEVSQNFSDKKHLFSVLFELTYKCNEKCQHCYVEHPNEETKKELSTDEVKCIIDNLYRANVGEITFSGGELFVRSDAIEIIEHAAQKGFLSHQPPVQLVV